MSREEEIRNYVDKVYPDLDLYSYYQLLGVESGASPRQVRERFYYQAERMHPDRYANLSDPQTRERLVVIYARVAEAYKVLGDPKKRLEYDQALSLGRMRYKEVERERKGPQNPEDTLSKPEAKKFLRLALQALQSKNWRGAEMNFKFALSYEPDSSYLKEQLQLAQNEVKKLSGTDGAKR